MAQPREAGRPMDEKALAGAYPPSSAPQAHAGLPSPSLIVGSIHQQLGLL